MVRFGHRSSEFAGNRNASCYYSPGEYMQSAHFNYPSPELSDHGNSHPTQNSWVKPSTHRRPINFTLKPYVSDRQCADGGAEYGWFRLPVLGASGSFLSQPPNVLTFYYSEFTNCYAAYGCAHPADLTPVFQKTNTYTITLNQPNAAETTSSTSRRFGATRITAMA
jgi:hypothetical protein